MALRAKGQPMFGILQEAQKLERAGKSILHFELGDPDFNTPKNIVDKACQSLKDGNTHYAPSMGVYEFRESIVNTTYTSRGFLPNIDQVLVTPGGNPIIYLVIACTTNPGDEVIVPDPGFPTYFSSIDICGAKAVNVQLREENNFQLSSEDVFKAVTSKTKLIILNSPSNPTGACMSKEELKKIATFANNRGIYLLSDEIYARLVYGNKKFYSPGEIDGCKENIIILNGFSKAFAMTGWRLGVAVGPIHLIKKMNLMLNTIVSCVPPFIQDAGIEAINGNQSVLNEMKKTYFNRMNLIVEGLNSINGISCVRPSGAMYVFPNIKKTGLSSNEFSKKCLEEAGVALLPGNCFGEYGEGFARLCFVNSQTIIKDAIERLEKIF
jgi:aspartate aminotransferase